MEKIPKTALRWLPPETKPDIDCTLPELWSRYCESISKRFENPEKTVAEYSSYLKQIEKELNKKSAALVTMSDCLRAAQSSKTYMRGGVTIPYEDDAPRRRLTVLRDIFELCENRDILISPLRYSPFRLAGRDGQLNWNTSEQDLKSQLASKAAALKQELGDDPLSKPAEAKLVRSAIDNLLGSEDERDGRWLGILCYLYMGIRPWEGLHMIHGGFHPFLDHPEAYYYDMDTFGDGKGRSKLRGKNKNAIRRIPVHPELLTVLRRIWAEVGKKYADVNNLPVIFYGNSYEEKCTGPKMLQFVREKLSNLWGEEKLAKVATIVYFDEKGCEGTSSNDVETRMNDDISTRIFRHNFALKIRAETTVDEVGLRGIMGHEQDTKIDNLFKQQNVYRWLLQMSSRRILPELTDNHITNILPKMDARQVDIGAHTLSISKDVAEKGLQVDITVRGTEPGGNIMLKGLEGLPPGVKVEILSVDYFEEELRDTNRRVDTSYDQQASENKQS